MLSILVMQILDYILIISNLKISHYFLIFVNFVHNLRPTLVMGLGANPLGRYLPKSARFKNQQSVHGLYTNICFTMSIDFHDFVECNKNILYIDLFTYTRL